MNRVSTTHRKAFTLIELLAVIAIIGVLMGILIPTISGVINTTKKGALKLEVDTLTRAVEEYRNKYGEYPPDGSDWGVFQRHIRKAFPQALATELDLLDPTPTGTSNSMADYPAGHAQKDGALYSINVDGSNYTVGFRNYMDIDVMVTSTFPSGFVKVMDPSEALVFFLGGFSSDPKRPFTGRGGPFAELTQANGSSFAPKKYQYNVSRENVLFEFDAGRLTIVQGLVEGSVATVSTDDVTYFTNPDTGNVDCLPFGFQADLLPSYFSKYIDPSENSPYVYFDSRTYVANKNGSPYFNFYQRSARKVMYSDDTQQYGAIYPMYSDVVNSNKKGLPGIAWTATNRFTAYQFMEPTKFQIIGPGLDGKYGGRLVGEVRRGTPAEQLVSLADTMFRYPSGNNLNWVPRADNNQPFRCSPSVDVPMANVDPRFIVRGVDNVANFSGPTMDAAP